MRGMSAPALNYCVAPVVRVAQLNARPCLVFPGSSVLLATYAAGGELFVSPQHRLGPGASSLREEQATRG